MTTDLRTLYHRRLFLARCAAWAIFGLCCVWLAWQNLQPDGKMTIRYDVHPGEVPALFEKDFASKEQSRIIGINKSSALPKYFQRITADPMYISIPSFRGWQTGTVTLTLDNPQEQSVMRMGIQHANGNVPLQPLMMYDQRLETLPPYWTKIRSGSTVLWQKNERAYSAYVHAKELFEHEAREKERASETAEMQEDNTSANFTPDQFDFSPYVSDAPSFASVQDFLDRLPDPTSVITFQYDLSGRPALPEYTPSTTTTEVHTSLRGKHTLSFYVGEGEDIDWEFTFAELNREQGSDLGRISVRHQGEVVLKQDVLDDGVTDDQGSVGIRRTERMFVESPGEGLYRMVIDVTNDMFITDITTKQHLFYFDGSIKLAESDEYRSILQDATPRTTILFTDGKAVTANTAHDAGLQTMTIGGKELTLDATHTNYRIGDLDGISTIVVPKNDVYIEGGGFAFTRAGLFFSRLRFAHTLENFEEQLDDHAFILSTYPEVRHDEQGLIVASAEFRNPDLAADGKRYRFLVQFPGMTSAKKYVHLYSLTITLTREPLTVRRAWNKMVGWLPKSAKRDTP